MDATIESIAKVNEVMFDLGVDICAEHTDYRVLHALAYSALSVRDATPTLAKPVSILRTPAELLSTCSHVLKESEMQVLFANLTSIRKWILSDQLYAKHYLSMLYIDITDLAFQRLDENQSRESLVQAGITVVKFLAQARLDAA